MLAKINVTIKGVVDCKDIIQKLKNKNYGKNAIFIASDTAARWFATKEKIELDTLFVIEEINFDIAYSKLKMTEQDRESFNQVITKLKENGIFEKLMKP